MFLLKFVIYLYQQFDEFLDKIIDRYGWTWFTQKQSETEKKLIELEKDSQCILLSELN